ncbi:MAG: hypothetical protein Q4B40_03675 [Clostridia bacterium]|nr:hypothetical protein [Clostridia bacterium]
MVFNVVITESLGVELALTDKVDGAKQLKISTSGIINNNSVKANFIDNHNNSGIMTVTFEDDGIIVKTELTEKVSEYYNSNYNLKYTLAQKIDKPESMEITSEMLKEWLAKKLTYEQLLNLGVEFEDKTNEECLVWDWGYEYGFEHTILGTEITIFFTNDVPCDVNTKKSDVHDSLVATVATGPASAIMPVSLIKEINGPEYGFYIFKDNDKDNGYEIHGTDGYWELDLAFHDEDEQESDSTDYWTAYYSEKEKEFWYKQGQYYPIFITNDDLVSLVAQDVWEQKIIDDKATKERVYGKKFD